jgi:oxygen-independent coproporphyrinogen-3 oxidase
VTLSRAQRVARYGGRAPRYTSYPTANHFRALDEEAVRDALPDAARSVSVYAHVPYCSKLCWYCGCNTVIRRNRAVGEELVDGLIAELALVRRDLPNVHMALLSLGGGTPNFLTERALRRLVAAIDTAFETDERTVRSTELDPRTVEDHQLDALTGLGFQRFSLGVQSLDPLVQQVVNRPFDPARLHGIATRLRAGGATSLNLDLMVGLPRQTPETMDGTLATVLAVRPERLAVFQYAHMPSLRPAQRLLARHGLPGAGERDALYRHVVERLVDAGYVRVGFDHFALPSDPLAVALAEGRLRRNFQGFTEDDAQDLVALGPSAIGRIGALFYQNHRDVGPWREAVDAGRLPVVRGLRTTADDQRVGAAIHELMCHGTVDLGAIGELSQPILARLMPLVDDGLVVRAGQRITVTEHGFDFVRAIAAAFDQHLVPEAHSSVA